MNRRVLFLGNNDSNTDQAVTELALNDHTQNLGLITDGAFEPSKPAYYHTTVVDIAWGDLITLARRFDRVVMLDQPQSDWSHWKCLQATCKLMIQLEQLGLDTQFRQNQNCAHILYWYNLVRTNPSICIYPWINLNNDGEQLKLCARDQGTVTTLSELKSWHDDPGYGRVRQAMLKGQRLPEHCSVCYDYEARGMESYRQFETLDWITQLEIRTIEALDTIHKPRFFEVHTGNKCNIKCRGCRPIWSAPIGREFRKFKIRPPLGYTNIFYQKPHQYAIDRIDIDSLDAKSSVYFQGGEPTIMTEVRDFLQRCENKGRTDFPLTMCTNGVRISKQFLESLRPFTNVNFSFSIDGYDRVNDYWRWGSRWNQVIANAHRMQDMGYSVSINTVPGIYNVTNLHLLMQFIDREFPLTAIYMQVNHLPWQSAYNHPLSQQVVDSMRKCQQTSIYHSNGKSCGSAIDSLLAHYSKNPKCDLQQLRNFFDYNDQLDLARGSKLADYIPELEAARAFLP